jgi:hypothetical protein
LATKSFPNSNLPTTSQPWGREVEKRVVDTAIKVDSNEVNNAARDRQLLAALNRTNLAVKNAQDAIDSIISVEEAVYYPGTTEIDGGNIRANTIAANKISAGELVGFDIKTGTTGQRVQMANSRIDFYDSGNNYAGGIFGASGPVISFSGGIGVSNASGFNGLVTMLSGLDVTGTLNVFSGGFSVASDSRCNGRITAGTFFTSEGLSGGGTTGASINNAGSIIRTTSSARYKQDIEDTLFDYEDILALQPKTFRLKEEAAEDDNARRYAGFIAEDLAGTPLDVFVAYRTNADGEREADGIYYAELTSALVSAIKHQDGMIKSLESRIEALESRV